MGLFNELMGEAPVPQIESDTSHYEAVGRFVTSFATAEAAVHMLARELSGLTDNKARIIFGGMRLPDLSDIIRHIVRIDNMSAEIQAEIDACLTQLGLISKKRHNLVHRSTTYFDGRLIVTNVLTTKSITAAENETFSVKELSDMQSDCGRIYLRLANIYNPTRAKDDDPLYRAMLMGPWRHKHAPPKTPNLKPRAIPAKRKRQPPASHPKPEG